MCSGAASEGGELGDDEQQKTPRRNSRDEVANIAMRESLNVAMALTRVAGGQSVVDKAQQHNILVKVSSPLRVRLAQLFLLTSGRLALRSILRTDLRIWAGTSKNT